MKPLNATLKKYQLKPTYYRKNRNATIVDSNQGKYVIKKKLETKDDSIYRYLESRNFNYYPEIISDEDDEYEISRYIEEIDTPEEQKITDMIELISLLHYKTTHYKEVDEDDYKKIFEDITSNIKYLNGYYIDIINIIETKVYMSPSEYLLARNISKIFKSIEFAHKQLDNWYDLIKDKRKQRFVVLHNNLEINHFMRNKQSYLISWDKAKFDIPIFDLYKLYKKHVLDYDFDNIFKIYEKNYPLLEEEKLLLYTLLTLPDKIEFDAPEYEVCRNISKQIDMLYKTEALISPYYTTKKKESTHNK